jgi:hypothetical protein
MTNNEFLFKIKDICISEGKRTNINPSLTGAQALIESKHGDSGLAVKANNLFGMKGTYSGQSVLMPTKEFVNGQYITVNAKFRKYPSWTDSIIDHSNLLSCTRRYKNLVGLRDYKAVCKLIQADGYATSPTYASTLINTIEKYKLYEWDMQAFNNENPYREPFTNVKIGMRGDIVKWIQYELKQNGYDLKIDGIFGEKTDACVRKFQFKNGLVTDGIVGKLTRAKLKE